MPRLKGDGRGDLYVKVVVWCRRLGRGERPPPFRTSSETVPGTWRTSSALTTVTSDNNAVNFAGPAPLTTLDRGT